MEADCQRWSVLANNASRRAPGLFKMVQEQLIRHHLDKKAAYAAGWERLWYVISSIGITNLWIQCNRVTFLTITSSVKEFWITSMRQQ